MNKKESVFNKYKIDQNEYKNEGLESDKYSICKKTVLNSIPEPNVSVPVPELAKVKIEWRWRFMKINNKDFIEISQKEHNSSRLYINSECQWVSRTISSEFDKYIEKTIYAYLDKK